jgi:1,4-alpha-glucan branching enzyme
MLLQTKTDGIVTFICELRPEAKEVYLAGDFNQWQPRERQMLKAKDGSFRVKMKLPPGQHQYKFIVDGVWHNDPDAPHQEKNNSGVLNSEFVVE